MAAASLLLRSAARSLLMQRPIPRAALVVSPRRLMENQRRFYSSHGVGTKPQTDMASQLERTQQDLVEKNKAIEEHVIYRMGNLNRGLDALEGKIDRLGAVLGEREVQYQKYDKWSLRLLCLTAISSVSLLAKKSLYG